MWWYLIPAKPIPKKVHNNKPLAPNIGTFTGSLTKALIAIATVAGMYRRKGIAELIEAFAQIAADFPDAHLYLVGNGPDREMFEAQAQSTAVVNLLVLFFRKLVKQAVPLLPAM